MKTKIIGLMLPVVVIIGLVLPVNIGAIDDGENFSLIFSDDFNDNYLDSENWDVIIAPLPELARVEEINQRLEVDIEPASSTYEIEAGVELLQEVTGEGIFEVDLQNGDSWNYLYKFILLLDEENKYAVRLEFLDYGPIVIIMRTPEHPAWAYTILFGGSACSWNWLFHLKLIRNSDGTFTGIVTDEYGHHFEGTTSLTIPLDVPLRPSLRVHKFLGVSGSSVAMIFFDNFNFYGEGPAEATEGIIEDVEEMDLPNGIQTALTSTLDAAINNLDNDNAVAAVNQLGAFINQVEAQRGNKLTEEQADYLVAGAQAIIDSL